MEDTYRKAFIKLNALNDSLLPLGQDPSQHLFDSSQWDSFNAILDELANVDQDRYYLTLKATPHQFGSKMMMSASNLSVKVYQAVSYLYSTQDGYLDSFVQPQKPTDVSRKSGQVITQHATAHQEQQASQTQETTVHVEFNQTMIFMLDAIAKAQPKFKEGTNERKFLDKLKDSVALAKNTADLIKMIVAAAAQFGISAEVLKQTFN